MADGAADVASCVTDVDQSKVAAIVKNCGIALLNRDFSLVSASDPKELATGQPRQTLIAPVWAGGRYACFDLAA